MSNAASAYARTAQATTSPRELEAHLLMKAATRLQAVKEDWTKAGADLSPSLLYNRKLWTIFASSVTAPESPLPAPVRENVANLAVFVFKRTIEIESAPAPEKLGALIEINRNLAAGLRGRAA
jgi:flagellar protein FlaF